MNPSRLKSKEIINNRSEINEANNRKTIRKNQGKPN